MISDFNELNLLFQADKWLEENFGCEFIRGGNGWLNSSCPFDDHEDSNPSFGINLEIGKFNCFGCSREGDFIELVTKLLNVKFVQAIHIIAEDCGFQIGNYDSFKFRNDKLKKALVEEDNEVSENKKLISKATIKIKNIMKHDFEKADSMYKILDECIETQNYKKIKEMINGSIR